MKTPLLPTAHRDGFATSIGALAATLGSAVGLGNIWKFPFLAGTNGGAVFVFTYLISVALVGLPVLVAELTIGRKLRRNALSAYHDAVPRRPWWAWIGGFGIAAAFLIMAFYTDVAGWVFAYVFFSLRAFITGSGPLTAGTFTALAGGTWQPILWQVIAVGVTVAIVSAGVSRGIERVTRLLMPILLVLLIVCDIRALTLPDAAKGVEFLFRPDFSKLNGVVILMALGLSFFKLSLGMGTMTTYGSYQPDSANLVGSAVKVALSDTLISLLAGLAIFPAVFAFGFEPSAGPSLLFMTIPMVFSKIPLGGLFTTLFFLLASIATIGAMVSLMEVPAAWLSERKKAVRRPTAALLSGAIMLVLGIPVTLSQGPLAGVKVFGKNLFDLADFVSSNVLLPIGGIGIAIILAWRWKKKDVTAELAKSGIGEKWYQDAVYLAIKVVAPVAIIVVLLNGLGVFGI
jgi:neurotransmitter:Na+ symporter, NSS family